MSADFVHLHVHSEYSLLDGASRIEQLVQEAARQGMKALALTDHGAMYGTVPFYKMCKQHGIKPIIGLEAYVTNGPLQAEEAKKMKDKSSMYHVTLLAETYEGYQNLLALTTQAHIEGFYYKPRITKELLAQHSDGLICLSGCLAGELQQALGKNEWEHAVQIAQAYQHMFGSDHFFIEIQDHGMPEQKRINPRLIQLAEQLEIPLVITNDVHYTYAQDAVAHDCLLCIGTGKKVDDTERLKFPSAQFYLKSPGEMHQLFPHLPQGYENTLKIAERCQVELPLGGEILPSYPVPDGKSAPDYLREKCEQGLVERYETVTDEIRERLQYELDVINQMGYADYFLIVWDFMAFAHERGIITGPGRGSAAGSLVAYVLHITNVDPIRYHLLFERFLNPERVTMPDIDIDFSDQRRDEVIEYVTRKYGQDRVAQIITFGTLGAKAGVRDVGRVLNVPLKVVDQVAKCIPSGPGVTLQKAWEQSEQLQKLARESEQVQHILKIAGQLEGLARHTSTHAAGVVISGGPLTEHVPLQGGHDDVPLTQFPMEDLEELGLLKMDFLGLRNLSLMEEIIRIVNEQRKEGEPLLTPDQIPLDDQPTFQLLAEGDTTGVFQLESEGMRQVLKKLRPTTFEDVIAVLALYRPGPMDNIPLFIEAKHGKTEVEYPHPDLKPILENTYGIIVYQEQIMQIASTMAGFSLGEADLLRRAVGKKKRDILEQERTHFVQGCIEQGYDKEVAEYVYDLIVRFADYGFNRSHSAAYAVIAFQLAYLKAHYPVAFLASLLSMNIGAEDKVAEYIRQASHRNIKVLPPSVVHSGADFSVENGSIRFGLSVIKHVGQTAIREILQAREEKPFESLLDFCQRVNLRVCNRRVIESLILAGAMDELGMHRAQSLANLDTIIDMSERAQGLKEQDQLFFFADELPSDYEWTDVPPFSHVEALKHEKEVLGFYLSGHPLDAYRPIAKHYGAVWIRQIVDHPQLDRRIRTVGYVNKVKRIKTKKGEAMAFVQLEDQGVLLDMVVFPKLFKQVPLLYEEGELLFVEGHVEEREDNVQLIAQKATNLLKLASQKGKLPKGEPSKIHSQKGQSQQLQSPSLQQPQKKLFIKISLDVERSGTLQQLKQELLNNRGNVPVYLYYERTGQTLKLEKEYDIEPTTAFLERLQNIINDASSIKIIDTN